MPDQWERHSKTSKDYWSGQPSRSQQRHLAANDDPTRNRPRSRRNPDLCKANHWQPHEKKKIPGWWRCGWGISYKRKAQGFIPEYRCEEHYVCGFCGKRLGYVPVRECSLYDAKIPAEVIAQAEAATIRRRGVRVLKPRTGYRKKRI